MSLVSILVSVLSLFLSYFLQTASGFPIVVEPGNVKDVIITSNNTVNATTPAGKAFAPDSDPSDYLKLALVNHLPGGVNAYITGLNANNQLVFVGPNGAWYFPSTSSAVPVAIPNGAIAVALNQGTTNIKIPGYLCSSRVWFAQGELKFFVVATPNGPGLVEPAAFNPNDPNAALNYGFAELTWIEAGGLFADISFVDFVGMPLGITLTTRDGTAEQQALGLPSTAVQSVCDEMKNQAKSDGQPWDQECVYTSGGQLIRVLAPNSLLSVHPSSFSGYFDNYVKEVFQAYSNTPLIVDTQTGAGLVKCLADMSSMTISCDGDNRPYGVPNAGDILGCNSGPFAIQAGDNAVHYAVVPRLCAAFNRGTFLLGADVKVQILGWGAASGGVQPGLAPSSYYTNKPAVYNVYSEAVHKYEWKGLGYAFSYDDVSPSQEQNVAGVVASGSPDTLTIIVGGYDIA